MLKVPWDNFVINWLELAELNSLIPDPPFMLYRYRNNVKTPLKLTRWMSVLKVLFTCKTQAGWVVLTSRRRCKHTQVKQLERERLIRQRSVTWTSKKVPAACQHLCVSDCLTVWLKSWHPLKSGAREMKRRPCDEWPRPSVHLSNFPFGNEMSSSLSVPLLNCSSRAAALRKWMTKWAYHLQQLLTGG